MSQLIFNDTTGKIKAIRVTDAVFSYSYLTAPRPEGQFQAGKYGTELIIRDEATVKLINQYLKEVITAAIKDVWNGKLPKDVHIPFEQGDDEVEVEAGAYILKTTSPTQPPLYVREAGEEWPRKLQGEEIEEIYAGMIGEAYVAFAAYNYMNKTGVSAYINGVCKTDDGIPFGGRANLEEVFANPGASGMDFSNKKASPAKKELKKVEVVEEEQEVDLAALVKKSSKAPQNTSQPATKSAAPKSGRSITVDDLIGN